MLREYPNKVFITFLSGMFHLCGQQQLRKRQLSLIWLKMHILHLDCIPAISAFRPDETIFGRLEVHAVVK